MITLQRSEFWRDAVFKYLKTGRWLWHVMMCYQKFTCRVMTFENSITPTITNLPSGGCEAESFEEMDVSAIFAKHKNGVAREGCVMTAFLERLSSTTEYQV